MSDPLLCVFHFYLSESFDLKMKESSRIRFDVTGRRGTATSRNVKKGGCERVSLYRELKELKGKKGEYL